MTNKPPPREFWVRTKDHDYKDVVRDMDRLCLDYEPEPEPQEVFTHVIEKSALDKLQAELDVAKKKIEVLSVLHTFCGNCREIKKRLERAESLLRESREAIHHVFCSDIHGPKCKQIDQYFEEVKGE